MKYLVFFIIAILSIGCNKKNPKEEDIAIPIYEINLDKPEKISVYDIFKSIEIIPLTTPDSVVCSGIHSYYYKDNIWLWDRRQKTILCFDSTGNYRYIINSKGRGPQEYGDILSVSIDPFNDYIIILDHQGILQFNLIGNFIKKIKYPKGLVVHSAMMINRDTMCCITETNNRKGKKIINYLSLEKREIIASCYDENPIFPVNRFISNFNGKYYYCISKTPIIYSLNNLAFTPAYQWDFGKYNYNYEDLPIPKLKELKDIQKIQIPWIYENCPWFMAYTNENQKYLYAAIGFFKNTNYHIEEAPTYHIFWNKETQEHKVISQFKEGCVFHAFSSWTDKAIYCVVEKSMMPEFMDTKTLTPENQKILEELPEDANPVVIKYNFK